jgi:serine/threonine protein kinase
MAEGLAYAHSQGIVHRDLKPENILIGQRNVAKIGDFGCSTRLEDRSEVLTSRVGSPAYMDYRVGRRQEYDHTADLYSLGMVFLWVFAGKGIYDECNGLTDLNRYQSQISRDFENHIQSYVERLPTPLDAIIKNCLSPDHRSRHSAQAIAAMIAARLSQDKSSTNLVSTQDELDELETERMQFAYRLMSLNKDFDRRYRNERTRESLLRLLMHNQQALEKIK